MRAAAGAGAALAAWAGAATGLAASAAGAPAGAASAAPVAARAPAPIAPAAARLPSTAVGVAQREFRIALYRRAVPPGEVRFNITNFGEDAHDLAVIAPSGRTLARGPEIRAGRRGTVRVRLRRAGTYVVVCTLSDHAARGMRARLLVRRPR